MALISFFGITIIVQLRSYWENACKKSNLRAQQIQALINHAPEAVAILDVETGRFIQANSHALQLFSTSEDATIEQLQFCELAKLGDWAGSPSTKTLENHIRSAAEGRSVLLEWRSRNEIGLMRTFTVTLSPLPSQAGSLIRLSLTDITRLITASEALQKQVLTDSLTGLPNRQHLVLHLADLLLQDHAQDETSGLILFDIEGLKSINRQMGYTMGDRVLTKIAHRLTRHINENGFVARHAGDEFAVTISHIPNHKNLNDILLDFVSILQMPIHISGAKIIPNISAGMAAADDQCRDPDDLIKKAEIALYEAKETSARGYLTYSPEIGQKADDQIRLVDELRNGLDQDEFMLLYQPVVELRSGRIAKAEALVRWNHPRLGLLSPNRFIQLAEDTNLISHIGDRVLEQSSRDLPRMQRHFGGAFQACVNVSAVELMHHHPDHQREWENLISRATQSDCSFVIEITESALLSPDPSVSAQLAQLRAAGAQLALDDFGAGYSSLLYFLDHDFDYLKIDRGFVRDLQFNVQAQSLCETMFGFANTLGGKAIAEGIETKKQLQILRGLGCPLGQGFLFSPPVPVEAILKMPQRLAA
ncbi:putative bifunctional diguanylate cyclase/phosphodiesterase [Pelagimonas sp.]|uniref:putative bifunctional diguanylate cyclase/phosphodiesterase n=1 Tax=Pelagimonas sp. TaxID=2073170 RepID=UPI003D6BC8CB